jgi:DNA-nicking Smr family endonuclease
MAKKPEISNNDKAEFREAMRDVKPLSHTKVHSTPSIPKRRIRASSHDEENSNTLFPFSDYEKLDSVGKEDLLEFIRPGMDYKILRKLRQGQYNIEAVLDLHGMNITTAREALGQFLLHCQRNGVRHVLMIHGKGYNNKAILKNKLNHWLRQTEYVLAFRSANPRDGAAGALYVLLRACP